LIKIIELIKLDTRYYKIILQKDLFGDWLVIRKWGGLKNNRRGGKVLLFRCFGKAVQHYNEMTNKKKRRGYTD
jgi:predicted DNA-binding WGR domain protein